MTKQVFLNELAAALHSLPREERYRTLGYYDELIDDRMEDGQSEEDAVASLGEPQQVAREMGAGPGMLGQRFGGRGGHAGFDAGCGPVHRRAARGAVPAGAFRGLAGAGRPQRIGVLLYGQGHGEGRQSHLAGNPPQL